MELHRRITVECNPEGLEELHNWLDRGARLDEKLKNTSRFRGRCEWNPKRDVPAMEPRSDGDCENTPDVVACEDENEPILLCFSCVDRDVFRPKDFRPITDSDLDGKLP